MVANRVARPGRIQKAKVLPWERGWERRTESVPEQASPASRAAMSQVLELQCQGRAQDGEGEED